MKFFSKLLVVQFILAVVLTLTLICFYPIKVVMNSDLPETTVGTIQYTYQKQSCLKLRCYTNHYADMR